MFGFCKRVRQEMKLCIMTIFSPLDEIPWTYSFMP